MIAGGHHVEIDLVADRAQLPVDEGHQPQHYVVVVGSCMQDDLVLDGPAAAFQARLDLLGDLLHGLQIELLFGIAALQVFSRQLVGVFVEFFAK